METLLQGHLGLEVLVAVHEHPRLHLVEIAFLPVLQCRQRLGEELAVVGLHAHVDGTGQLHPDETAVAGGVGEDVVDVARGDEGCRARELLHMTAVGTLDLHRGQLDDVLQEALLHRGGDLVEFIEVDDEKLRHRLQHLPFLREDEVVVVAPLQLPREETAAERALVVALLRDEEGTTLLPYWWRR